MKAPPSIVAAICRAVEKQTIAVHHASVDDALADARHLIAEWERIHGGEHPAADDRLHGLRPLTTEGQR